MRRAVWHVGGVGALAAALLLAGLGFPGTVGAAGWQSAGTLPAAYESPVATLLPDGRVLAVYGKHSTIRSRQGDSWTALAPLEFDTFGAQLLALAAGQALLTGGSPNPLINDSFGPTRQVLRFDPGTNRWSRQADMPTGRGAHTMTTLADGRVLVVGGSVGGLSPRQPRTTVGAVDIYDPETNAWAPIAPLAQPRSGHSATLLADGRVLVVGGAFAKTVNSENAGSEMVASAEIYTPRTGTWQPAAPLRAARSGHTATLLLDGTVLVVGGEGGAATSAERYDPQLNRWAAAGSLGTKVGGFAATLLLGGDVLVTGGQGTGNTATATVARFTPGDNSWQPFASLATPRAGHSALLVNGEVLAIGGQGRGAASSAERYDATPAGTVCHPETGRCVGGAFETYWRQHGQLPINGYPLSNPFPEQLEDGQVYLVQYFERVRFEAHPENVAPNDVLLGQFGRRIHPADPPVPPPGGPITQDGFYFEETGHYVPGRFFAFWNANGGLPQFGYPISEAIDERLEDGNVYRVQYFERARFEYHPENVAPYDVLLGQFGRRILAGRER